MTLPDRGHNLGPGRVNYSGKAQKNDVFINVLMGYSGGVAHILVSRSNNPLPFPGQLFHFGIPELFVYGLDPVLGQFEVGHGDQRVGRAFDHVHILVAALDQGGHIFVFRVEWYGVQPDLIRFFKFRFFIKGNQGAFCGVAAHFPLPLGRFGYGSIVAQIHAGNQAARGLFCVEINFCAVFENFSLRGISASGNLEIIVFRNQRGHGHFVFGERSGFVRTDYRNRAQGFNRRQGAHNGLAPGHVLHAHGQNDGKNGGQPFGDGPYGQADYGKKKFARIVAAEKIGETINKYGQNDNNRGYGFAEF